MLFLKEPRIAVAAAVIIILLLDRVRNLLTTFIYLHFLMIFDFHFYITANYKENLDSVREAIDKVERARQRKEEAKEKKKKK